MSNLIFDIETNGLLEECTRLWIMNVYDYDTGEWNEYLEGDNRWMAQFDSAEAVTGHHILGFDLAALQKITGYKLPKHVKKIDTLIYSQILDYRRFRDDGHSLDRWGQFFGIPKPVHEDWSQFSEEMRIRNRTDVEINIKVFEKVREEFLYLKERKPYIQTYIRAEHYAAEWATRCKVEGWPFDREKAVILERQLFNKLEEARLNLEAKLGTKTVAIDKCKGVVEEKVPRWTKFGAYDHHTAKYFDVHPFTGLEGEERMIEGPYCRVEFKPLNLASSDDVKRFLFRHGWQPTEYNFKIDPETRERTKTSPKITEDSLEFLGGDGKLYIEYLTNASRYGILKTWLENLDENDRLHGDMFTIGTPSMRSRHSIIVNVPSAEAAWGKEMRQLFKTLPGWKMVGCDSSGNQARGLAHYLGDAKFIDTLLNGDIHQFNADILNDIVHKLDKKLRKAAEDEGRVYESFLPSPDFVVKRAHAKRILYAFLFGASGAKLWSYIFGLADEELGKVLKREFIKAVPGFKSLNDRLNGFFKKTRQGNLDQGFIPSWVGNKIYVDSAHKLLVYLLQSMEKITCATALMMTVDELEARGIPYIPCIFYHDEIDFLVPEQYEKEAADIGKNAFKEGPKLYGIEIMDGGAKTGDNWYDVH